MLVTVLLLPPVEFVIIRVIGVHGVWVEDGGYVPLFPFAFIRHVFRCEEGADIRIVSGKELELRQQVFCALEIRKRAAGAYEGRWVDPEVIGVSKLPLQCNNPPAGGRKGAIASGRVEGPATAFNDPSPSMMIKGAATKGRRKWDEKRVPKFGNNRLGFNKKVF